MFKFSNMLKDRINDMSSAKKNVIDYVVSDSTDPNELLKKKRNDGFDDRLDYTFETPNEIKEREQQERDKRIENKERLLKLLGLATVGGGTVYSLYTGNNSTAGPVKTPIKVLSALGGATAGHLFGDIMIPRSKMDEDTETKLMRIGLPVAGALSGWAAAHAKMS